MRLPPAVIVHGCADATAVLACGRPVTLLSAAGAGLFGGGLWWRAVVAQAGRAHPDVPMRDLLDCGDASGYALAALRAGLRGLVLAPQAPGRHRVAELARGMGALLLAEAPDALDMASHGAEGRLHDWLCERGVPGDSGGAVR